MKRFGKITTIAMALGLGITGFSATASAASNCPLQNLTNATTQNQWVQNMAQMPQLQQLQQQFPQLKQLQMQFPQMQQQWMQQSNCPWKVNIQTMMPQYVPQQYVPQQQPAVPQQPMPVQQPQQQAPVAVPSQPAPATQPTPAAPVKQVDNQADASSYAKQVADLVNQERAKAGLTPLQFDASLSKVALAKASDMSQNHYFDHTSPTYGSPFDMMKQFGINFMTAGENIAMGQRSPQEVMTQWMNSAGHRQNIMNSSFTKIGVGYVNGYWVQEFIG